MVDTLYWLTRGGVLMVPIAACGVAAAILIIERAVAYRRMLSDPSEVVSAITQHLRRLDVSAALRECQGSTDISASVVAPALVHEVESTGRTRSDLTVVQAIVEEEMQVSALPRMYRRLSLLATVGRVAPLLGLLGTIQGMIQMFLVVRGAGMGMSSALAGGMAVALSTTFAGLCVAIPVQIAEGVFEEKIDAAIPRLRRDVSAFLSALRELRFQERVIRIEHADLAV
ncbi:MAG: MotA/TolQ/ExbB proton channel family protein [Phycisphaerae bacterium]|nr:MotA/TolQ/ExbB proton channel family protein [Phycisphaerae bacterium]